MKLQSRHISEVNYEEGRLFVRFTDNSLYVFDGVDPELYEGLVQAKSHSTFFRENIKGRHKYQKVG